MCLGHMTGTSQISVVVADESALFCEALAAVCEDTGRFRVVGHCCDGLSAVKMILSLRPRIGVFDLSLPKLHSAAVIRKVRSAGLDVRLLVMSARRARSTVLTVFREGAHGFLLKSDPARHFVDALTTLESGSIYVSPQLRLTEVFEPHRSAAPKCAFDGLSPREHQVFSLLVQGLRGKEIAGRLDLSPKTVDTYRSGLMRKLEIYDIAGLVKFAIQNDLTPLV